MRHFGAPWDRSLALSTTALLAVVLLAAVGGTTAALDAGMRGVALAIAVFSAGTASLAWAFAPRGFALGAGALRVLRNGWWPTVVPLAGVRSAGEIDAEALRGSVRTLGVGGLFGSYGLYRSPALGSFRLHATRSSGLVLVRTDSRVYVVTPDRPAEFVEALLAEAPSARRDRRLRA